MGDTNADFYVSEKANVCGMALNKSKNFLNKFFPDETGSAMVEFVLLLPVILMVFLVVIDFGTYMLERQNLSSVTRGVVTIVTNTEDFAIDTQVLTNYAQTALGGQPLNFELDVNKICSCDNVVGSCELECGGNPSKMLIEATLSYDHTLLFPYPGIDESLPISDTVTFRVR